MIEAVANNVLPLNDLAGVGTAQVSVEPRTQGVVFAQGSWFGGRALYIVEAAVWTARRFLVSRDRAVGYRRRHCPRGSAISHSPVAIPSAAPAAPECSTAVASRANAEPLPSPQPRPPGSCSNDRAHRYHPIWLRTSARCGCRASIFTMRMNSAAPEAGRDPIPFRHRPA